MMTGSAFQPGTGFPFADHEQPPQALMQSQQG
jgi:hypothetical protein